MARKKKKGRGFSLPGLGYSPAQKTASGAGTHGGGKRARRRRERAQSRRDIRDQRS